MKHTTTILLSALALGVFTSLSNAQGGGGAPAHRLDPAARGEGGRSEGRRPSGSPLIAVIDTNRDGIIEANELVNAPAALQTLDKDGDGSLAMTELAPTRPLRPGRAPAPAHLEDESVGRPAKPHRPVPPEAPAPPHAPGPVLLALDANNDGVIDAAELANATAALGTLDTNADGQLTPEELQPLRHERAGGGHPRHAEGRRPAPGHAPAHE